LTLSTSELQARHAALLPFFRPSLQTQPAAAKAAGVVEVEILGNFFVARIVTQPARAGRSWTVTLALDDGQESFIEGASPTAQRAMDDALNAFRDKILTWAEVRQRVWLCRNVRSDGITWSDWNKLSTEEQQHMASLQVIPETEEQALQKRPLPDRHEFVTTAVKIVCALFTLIAVTALLVEVAR
jgi:hypothetical protein